MTNVVAFTHAPVRALVVEQLNEAQWHVAAKGAPVPEGSWEDEWTGVDTFALAVADAIEKAQFTGLPVFVEAYEQGPRPLSAIAPPADFPMRPRARSTLDEIMSGRGAA